MGHGGEGVHSGEGERAGRGRSRAGLLALALLALAGPAAGQSQGSNSSPPPRRPPDLASACAAGAARPAGSLGLAAGGDLTWSDAEGRAMEPLRLAGIQLSDDPALASLLVALVQRAGERGVRIVPAGPADRWGRTPAWVLEGSRLLNETALAEGLARYRPGAGNAACARLLAGAEAQARRTGQGGWAADRNAGGFRVLDASEPGSWGEAIGRFAIIEGRVAGIGETRSRVYLNFGDVGSEDFTIVIQKRNLRNVEASGMRWTSWEGRRIRVRGTVVESAGPLVEVKGPEDIERLD